MQLWKHQKNLWNFQGRSSGVFIVNFEHYSGISIDEFEQANPGWVVFFRFAQVKIPIRLDEIFLLHIIRQIWKIKYLLIREIPFPADFRKWNRRYHALKLAYVFTEFLMEIIRDWFEILKNLIPRIISPKTFNICETWKA